MPFNFQNLVGYQTIKLRDDSNLLGVNWESVGKDGKAKLVDILDCSKLTSINEDFDDLSGDYVMAWDSVKGNWNSVTFQYCDLPVYGKEYEKVWLGDEYAIGPTEIPSGTGFWYFAKKAGVTITFK